MARQFIYDNVGFSEATLTTGTKSGGDNFDSSSPTIASIARISDQNITTGIASGEWSQYDTVQIDLGSAQSSDTIALYHIGADNNNLEVYASNDSGGYVSSGGSNDWVATLGNYPTNYPTNDWKVFSASVSSKRYIYIYDTTANNYDYLSEMIIGSKYTFDVNPELNSKITEEFGTDVIISYGGDEYANKRHSPSTVWDFSFSHILSTQKTALEALNSNVQDWKKFIYKDDSSYHYVRLVEPINFTEVAPNVFSANIKLREQF
tara:strand:+ start:43 stop:831 length:789 start_codon:yes stop_codon:yes gene_type:complete